MKNKGITLIALVVSIVVILIISGVSLNLIINNGIFNKANESIEKSKMGEASETFNLVMNEWFIDKNTDDVVFEEYLKSKVPDTLDDVIKINDEKFELQKNGYSTIVSDSSVVEPIKKTIPDPELSDIKIVLNSNGTGDNLNKGSVTRGKTVYISFKCSINDGTIASVTCDKGNTNLIGDLYVTPTTDNDSFYFNVTGLYNGKEKSKTFKINVDQFFYNVSVGQWIDYKAGNWTEDEIEKLGTLYYGYDLPKTGDYFGGFQVGTCKDNNVHIGAANISSGKNGWRILNKNDDGTISIISAGVTEGFHYTNVKNGGYRAEYILGGKKNPKDDTDVTNGFITRDWSMYVNENYASSAHCSTFNEIYNITGSTNTTYKDLRTLWSYYWLPYADTNNPTYCYLVNTGGGMLSGALDECQGVRPVVILKSNVFISNGDGSETNPWKINY